jgi:glycerophosphoryl diester phosphodiesterase
VTSWAYLDHPRPIAFAHRGGGGDWPENTMRAFANAVALGYRYVETDVHATADGAVVAFHDDSLDRLTDGQGRIADLEWETVRAARVEGEPIPLLEDLLGTWPDLRVNIDAKHDAVVRPLLAVIDRMGAHDRVCLASFSDRRLVGVRRLCGGRICTAAGPRTVARLRAAGYGAPTGPIAAGCVQVPPTYGRVPIVDTRFLVAAHRRNLPVHVWVVDDAAEMERLLDLGVDGIMSGRPAVLKEVLQRRGEWP